jgi:hypothetical protein
MNIFLRSLSSLFLVLALAFTGCSNLTPGENAAIAAGVAGTAAGVALGASGVSPGITIPVALGAAALAGGGTYLYAKNRASIDQRRIAEARARLYYARLDEQQQNQTGRYLAVKTSGSQSQNQGQSVMLYDTQTGQVGNTVYNVKSTPSPGQQTTLDSTPATYIGSGK